jgi:hypothetical protein
MEKRKRRSASGHSGVSNDLKRFKRPICSLKINS